LKKGYGMFNHEGFAGKPIKKERRKKKKD